MAGVPVLQDVYAVSPSIESHGIESTLCAFKNFRRSYTLTNFLYPACAYVFLDMISNRISIFILLLPTATSLFYIISTAAKWKGLPEA